MDAFRKKLKRRIVGCAVCMALMAVLFFALQYIGNGSIRAGDGDGSHLSSFLSGYQHGFWVSLEVLFLAMIVNNMLSLRNEKRLRKQYIKETDERSLLIWQKCRATALKVVTLALASATIVAGYYDKTVFFTLVFTLYFIGATIGLTRLYYAKKLK